MLHTVAPSSPIFQLPGVWGHIYILPVISFVGINSALIISYMISVSLNHSIWFWPYVSDVATCAPETSIFAAIVNVVSLTGFLCYYIRFKLVQLTYSSYGRDRRTVIFTLNSMSPVLGAISALGMSLGANFPEIGGGKVHLVAGIMAYSIHVFYWVLQIAITAAMSWRSLYRVRANFWICVLVVLDVSIMNASGSCRNFISTQLWRELMTTAHHCNNKYVPDESWDREDGTRYWYAATTIFEWLLSLTLSIKQIMLAWQYYKISTEFKQRSKTKCLEDGSPVRSRVEFSLIDP